MHAPVLLLRALAHAAGRNAVYGAGRSIGNCSVCKALRQRLLWNVDADEAFDTAKLVALLGLREGNCFA